MIHQYAFVFSHLAFLLIFYSFTVRSMLRLRTISVLASVFSTTYAFNATDLPLWPIIFWNTVFVSTNLFHISRILREQRLQDLTERERFFGERALKNFPPPELRTFLAAANPVPFTNESSLITKGTVLDTLYLISRGMVRIEVDKKPITKLQAGTFLGEMSFLSHEGATADAFGENSGELLTWTHDNVRDWMSKGAGREALLVKACGLQLIGLLTKSQPR